MQEPTSNQCICFAGPTRAALRARVDQSSIEWRGPIKRGDVDRLVSERPPGKLAIVDGIFHSYPAVGHAEILEAIRRGWQIWGLSSMGAIRAAEMTEFGMRGYGRVFQLFATNPGFADDEVTLIHGADFPFEPLSEPLVHMRVFVDHLVETGVIAPDNADSIVRTLKERWYGYRTLDLLASQLDRHAKDGELAKMEMASFDRFRLKTLDLEDFLRDKPWVTRDDAIEFAGRVVS
jgi:hypothetical protein